MTAMSPDSDLAGTEYERWTKAEATYAEMLGGIYQYSPSALPLDEALRVAHARGVADVARDRYFKVALRDPAQG